MKRNILLLFGLIGLVVMEWGCTKNCDEFETYEILDLSVGTIRYDTGSSITEYKYDQHIFSIRAQTELVAHNNAISSGLYASVLWGCEIETHISYTTDIDSFTITTDKAYNSDLGNDLSKSLAHVYNRQVIEKIDLSKSHQMMTLDFALKYPPSQRDTFQFTFQFFDSDGNMFESTTEPIVVIP